VLGTDAYMRVRSWLPIKRVHYGIIIGEPISVPKDVEKHEATKLFLDQLRQTYVDLHAELKAAMAGDGTKNVT
jgi:hypothetical protein